MPGGQEDVDVHFNAGDDAAEGRELPNKSHFFVQALAAGPRPCRPGRETDPELSRAVLPMPQASALLPERLRRGRARRKRPMALDGDSREFLRFLLDSRRM